MKKYTVVAAICLLAACSQVSNYISSGSSDGSSVRSRMHSCLVSEAQSRLYAGTLFTNTVSATADELVTTCTKQLAFQSLGISDESRTAAENIITNLQTLHNAAAN